MECLPERDLNPRETPVYFICSNCGHENDWCFNKEVDIKDEKIACEKCGEIYNPESYLPDPYDMMIDDLAESYEEDY